MLERPRFKPHLRVEVVAGEGAFVLSGSGQTLLRGRLYEQVVPWVGRGRSADEVCDALEGRVSAAEVYYVLGQLEKKGFLCGEEAIPDGESAWWWSQGVDPRDALRRLAAAPVAVRSLGVDAQPLRSLLEGMRVSLAEGDEGAADRGRGRRLSAPRAGRAQRRGPARGRSWLLFRPVGRQIWAGPLFRPGVTGAGNAWPIACGRTRRWPRTSSRGRAGRMIEPLFRPTTSPRRRPPRRSPGDSPPTPWRSWIVQGELPHLEGKIQTFDPSTWKSESHAMAGCPSARPAAIPLRSGADSHRPIVLERRPGDRTRDGGYRTVPPEVRSAEVWSSRQPDHGGRVDAPADRARRRGCGRRAPCTSTSRGTTWPGDTAAWPTSAAT